MGGTASICKVFARILHLYLTSVIVYETTVTQIDAICGQNSQIGQRIVQICLESKFAL